METIIKSVLNEDIKDSSFKNYLSATNKLFNLCNVKKPYKLDMTEKEILSGLGNVINNFKQLHEFLESNDYSNSTKKNYMNIILNIILKIKDIEKYFRYKNKSKLIIGEIKDYWLKLREIVEKKYNDKKNKKTELEKVIDYQTFRELIIVDDKDTEKLYGLYEINKNGEVRSVKTKKVLRGNLNNARKEPRITLITEEKKKRTFYICDLMCSTYLHKTRDDDIFIFRDSNVENLNLDNLLYVKNTNENIDFHNNYSLIKLAYKEEPKKEKPKKEKEETHDLIEEETEKKKYPCVLKIHNTRIHLGYCDSQIEVEIMLEKKAQELYEIIEGLKD